MSEVLPFTAELARLSPEAFVEQIVVEKLQAQQVHLGPNFRFGHRQQGDTKLLAQLAERFGFRVELFGEEFRPVPVLHGKLEVFGFAFRRAAYVTDFSVIPPPSKEYLMGLDLLVLDALRRKPHPTHSSLDQSLALVEELEPRQAYFTHICHDLPYEATNAALPENVALAYDGLQVEIK